MRPRRPWSASPEALGRWRGSPRATPTSSRELRAALPGLGDRAARRATTSPRRRRDATYENARAQGALRARARAGGRVGARRGLGHRGRRRSAARPGVRSARWAPSGGEAIARCSASSRACENRRARYVSELVADRARTARSCAAPACSRAGSPTSRAATEGFGYDPIFVPTARTRTVAELGDGWKREHSHRARAAARSRDSHVESRSAALGEPGGFFELVGRFGRRCVRASAS